MRLFGLLITVGLIFSVASYVHAQEISEFENIELKVLNQLEYLGGDNFIKVTPVKNWENEEWNRISSELEPNWEKYQFLIGENRNTIKIPGVQMSVVSSKKIIPTSLHKIPFNLPVYVDIRHTCEKSRSGDEEVIVIEWIEARWRRIGEGEEQKLKWHINTKLLPIGEELKELETIENELKTAKDQKRIIELGELKRTLKEKVKEGLLDYRIEIPSPMLPYLEPGDTLVIQVIASFEHDGEVRMIEAETFLYVIHDMTISVDAIQAAAQKLDNSIQIPNSAYYMGDQHLHSTYSSDGDVTIDQLADGAYAAGYDYIIVTDHSHDIDEDTVPPHNSPTWQAIGNDCSNNTTPGVFACIRGEEISVDEGDSGGLNVMHYLAYDIGLCVGSVHPIFPDELPASPDFHNYWYNDETVFDYVEIQQGGFGVVAHPHGALGTGLGSGSWDYHGYPQGPYGMEWGVEAWNGSDAGKALDLWQWKIDRSETYGPCYGWGNSDSHRGAADMNVWTWTYASDIYPNYILQGMRSGNAAFSNGPFIASYVLDVDGEWQPMGSMPLASSPFTMYVYWKSWDPFGPVTEVKLLSANGEVIYSFNPNNLEGAVILYIEASTGRHPLRLEASTSEGKEGYSNPIWVDVNRVRLKPIADAFTDLRDDPGGNYGSETSIAVNRATNSGPWPSGVGEGTFLKFDLSGIPSDATIQSATFCAYAYQIWYKKSCDSHLRAFGTDWSESTITGNNAPWETLGDAVSTSTHGSIPSWWAYGIDGVHIQGKLGGEVGFYLCYPDRAKATHYGQRYYSKEFQDPSYHPYLEISYTLEGTTVMLQPIADAFVDSQDNPGGNYGSETWIAINRAGATRPESTWLKFDLSSIPSSATVTSAVFKTYAYQIWYGDERSAALWDVTTNDWSESTITANNAPWGNRDTKISSDILGLVPGWWEWDVTSWVDTHKGTIRSAWLSNDLSVGSAHYGQLYYSKEYGNTFYRPYLQITYIVETPKIYPSGDAFVDSQDDPGGNYGSETWIAINQAGATRPESTWLKFDLSSIPSSATVTSAVFKTYAYQIWYGDERSAALWDVTTNGWSESTITANNAPWGNRGTKISSDILGSVPGWWEWDVTSWVDTHKGTIRSAWLSNDWSVGYSHYGQRYYSKEYADAAYRPYLEVTYS